MRTSLGGLYDDDRLDQRWHFGLAYERGLLGSDDLENDEAKDAWLRRLGETKIALDYCAFLHRWRASLANAGSRVFCCVADSRLLVGHGNPSVSEVGSSVHHTWGVPMLPGSALKGLTAHYVAERYGPAQAEDEPEREPWRGVVRDGKRVVGAPGRCYRELFGAPEIDEDDDSKASAGAVVFHDGLYLPTNDDDRPFARDVLTVHQKRYYDSNGREGAPCDHDDPNPVGFLTIEPKSRFLLALSGPERCTKLAQRLLLEALDDWGIGGKTSLGYGRMTLVETKEPCSSSRELKPSREETSSAPPGSTRSDLLREFVAALKADKADKDELKRDALTRVLGKWPQRLLELDARERVQAANKIETNAKKLKKRDDASLKEQLLSWAKTLRG